MPGLFFGVSVLFNVTLSAVFHPERVFSISTSIRHTSLHSRQVFEAGCLVMK